MFKGKRAVRPAAGIVASKATNSSKSAAMTSTGIKESIVEDDDEDDDDLMISLKRHDEAFTSLLSLIPAQFYLTPTSEGSSASDDVLDSKYTKNKRKQDKPIDPAERKMQIKEAKRAKLDPDNFKSAAQIQVERKAISPASSDEMQLDLDDGLVDGSRAGDTDSGDDDDDDDDDSSAATQLTSVKGSEEAVETGEKDVDKQKEAITGIQDLRARLQAKIQGLQSKRNAPALLHKEAGGEGDGDDDSVASTKDELLEERRKKRGEMRDKRRQAMKQRRRNEKVQSGQDKKGGNAAGNASKGNTSKPPALIVPDKSSAGAGRISDGNAANNLAFSSLQFGDEEGHKGKKSRHALPSDPKAALAIVEARKKKEEARETKRGGGETGEEGVKERKEREKWSKVEAAAQGVKIRDDEALLKKAAKKKDKIKEKSRKEWTDREKEKIDQAASRQKKRNDNIAARKDRSKKGGKGIGGKKMGSGGKSMGGSKKTRARPGFEGKQRHSKGSNSKSSHK